MAAAGGSEQKELLALMHQHLVQIGYERAARELLAQSGQKTFLPSPVPLGDIFTQWKKTSSQAQKRKAEEIKQGSPAKIRVPDPKSSSESSEEEAAKPIKSNVAVNNSSLAKAESSSEDEESSSEEEEAAGKEVNIPAAGNKTSNLLQLAAQKTNSFPGKGVAVAAVQAKGQQKKATANKPPTPAVTKAGQNKILPVKPGSASQPLAIAGQNASQAAAARKTKNSESSSSSSSESEEEKTPAAVKTPVPKPALKKAESSSGDSSDDSDSEEETNTATLQVKPAAESRQVATTPTKSVPATAVKSKGNAVKASPAKKTAQQTRARSGNVAKTTKPADSSETSDSSDTEIEEPSLATQAKSPGKSPQTFSSPVKNAAAPSLLSTKTVSVPALLKQTPKTSAVKQPPPAKAAGGGKKAESSESSESSSENEDEAPSVPVSQKKLQTPQPPAGARQNQIDKPGTPAKAVSSALKGKETESESSSSSDSEEEMIPPTQQNLPPPFATKANASPQVVSAAKSLPPPGGPLQKAQESEDSSQDSSDESDSEEDKVFTQKPAQETQKPTPAPAKAPAAKMAGATSDKAGNAQPAGKVGTASPMKSAAASLQKAAESSETDSSDSSEDEVAAAKPVKQPPIHPFFLPKAVKTAAPPGKRAQAGSSTPNSVSTKCQGPAAVTTGKVEQSSSKKPKLSQALPDKPDGIPKHKESSGSSSSSDSEEEALTTAKQIPQPASIPQKQGVGGKPESSSEATSSDEDQEASQSLLKGFVGPIKTPLPTLPKGAAPALSKQSSRKAASALRGPPISMASGDSSSSDSSDSDADAKEKVGQKTEIGPLPSSGKEVAKTKGAAARKKGAGSVGSKAASAKKAATKAQSNGSTKRKPAGQLPLTLQASTQTAQVGSEEAAAQAPGAAAQGEPQATPVAAVKRPKATKSSKAGAKEKPSKKRKLAAGDAGLGEPKGKKLKAKSGVEVPKKLKKKKKDKSSTGSETPKKKGSKEKKADKKKKKSKKLESLTADGSKKKKKKKKTGDLEGAA
ncbi:treacle protein [Podarcis muralis]